MLLSKLLETLIEHTIKLDELAEEKLDLRNWKNLYLVLHTFQVHAQAAIDYLLRVCSLLALSSATPIDCVAKLNAENLVSEKEAELLKKMIRFRNIVVHEYGKIDVERVRVMLESRSYRAVTNAIIQIHKRLVERGLEDP